MFHPTQNLNRKHRPRISAPRRHFCRAPLWLKWWGLQQRLGVGRAEDDTLLVQKSGVLVLMFGCGWRHAEIEGTAEVDQSGCSIRVIYANMDLRADDNFCRIWVFVCLRPTVKDGPAEARNAKKRRIRRAKKRRPAKKRSGGRKRLAIEAPPHKFPMAIHWVGGLFRYAGYPKFPAARLVSWQSLKPLTKVEMQLAANESSTFAKIRSEQGVH